MRRRLELLFLDVQRRRSPVNDRARSNDGPEEESDPAFEALIQRIVDQERRCNAIARCWRETQRTRAEAVSAARESAGDAQRKAQRAEALSAARESAKRLLFADSSTVQR
jgi:hypothetical protein